LRYVCNAGAALSSAEDAPNTASCARMAMDLRQIGNELGVRYAIEGSVQATSSLGINARLVDAQNGAHVLCGASIATTASFPDTR
jgi:hypothetical protein